MTDPLIEARDLKKHFPAGRASVVHAVDGVSFAIGRGETLALVGESGCGKSTVGRTLLRLEDPTSGEIWLDGHRIDELSPGAFRPTRRKMQVIFQDPFSSLNPRMRVADILAEPIRNFGLAKSTRDVAERVAKVLDMVRLPGESADRYPHQFSGGQRQRIAIARALAAEPEIIVCDEAVSALDVSVKAKIVNLLADLQAELGLALLFISHDLAIVDAIAHRIAVMYLGRIVEQGSRRQVFAAPRHPYTQALLSAVPQPEPGADRKRILLSGEIPSPIDRPAGCHFHTRCPMAMPICREIEPVPVTGTDGHISACHLEQPIIPS